MQRAFWGALCPQIRGSDAIFAWKFLKNNSCLDVISCNLGHVFNDFRQSVFFLSWYPGSTSWCNVV